MANDIISIDTKKIGWSYFLGYAAGVSKKTDEPFMVLHLVDIYPPYNGTGYSVRQFITPIDDSNKDVLKKYDVKVGDLVLPTIIKQGFKDKLIGFQKEVK